MIVIQVKELAKSYGADIIFENASFIINKGEKVGLVGPNGIGKSTLLKCISGMEVPDQGKITFSKGIKAGYLAQAGEDYSGNEKLIDIMLSEYRDILNLRELLKELESSMGSSEVLENDKKLEEIMAKYSKVSELYERQGGYSFESKIRGMLIGLGFKEKDFERKICTFSGGQKTRISLARLLLREPELLLLDEPTNFLDMGAVEWLEDYLANYPGAVLVVSHDRYFLDKIVERILELEKNGISSYKGNYTRYVFLKNKELESNLKTFQKQQEKIQRMEEFVRRYKAGIKAKQARGRQKMLERLEKIEKPQASQKKLSFSFDVSNQTGEMVLELDQIKMGYSEDQILFDNLNLTIYRGERVALLGKNGTGKSTLLKIITGNIETSGRRRLGSRVKIAYFDQEHDNLTENNTVLEEVYTGPHITLHEARSLLGRFHFSVDDVDKKVKELSGGERVRLILAKLFLQQANFLVLDEPTNHLDITTREALELALIEFPGTILFVSHDRYFINRLATRVLELENKKLTEYIGDYDYYRWKKNELLQIQRQKDKVKKNNLNNRKKQNSTAKSKNMEPSLDEIEKRIEELEEKAEEIALKLGDVSVYTDNNADVGGLTEEYNIVNSELDSLYELWEKKLGEVQS